MLPARDSSGCLRGSEFTTGATALRTKREPTYSTTLNGSIVPGCDVESLIRIGSCQWASPDTHGTHDPQSESFDV